MICSRVLAGLLREYLGSNDPIHRIVHQSLGNGVPVVGITGADRSYRLMGVAKSIRFEEGRFLNRNSSVFHDVVSLPFHTRRSQR